MGVEFKTSPGRSLSTLDLEAVKRLCRTAYGTTTESSSVMHSEESGQTTTVKTEETTGALIQLQLNRAGGDSHVHREDVRKVWKECQEESFWYRDTAIMSVKKCEDKPQAGPAEEA
ncbi:hypothetical protein CHARACLAT_030460 [Characodon lateralis]|uniref:Uncharacterized protein n=1 Tax=Characodon lateralis TaxID=208331 RepID=A0ABU7D484_9TELE|nr:hypothetical protein [Characodon lateralis]